METDYISRSESFKLEESELEKVKKALPNIIRNGAEIITSADSFASSIKILGRTVVGNALSEISLTQCSGLVGLILSTVAPEVWKYSIWVMYNVSFLDNNSPSSQKDFWRFGISQDFNGCNEVNTLK